MLRLEKIKEYKNLKSFYRIIYSEAHGMILSVNCSGTGMKVHSFASGKLLLQHRFPDEGKFSRMLRVGRWVFIWLYSSSVGRGALLVCDLETLSVRELILCKFARGTLGRIGNRLFFPVRLHPVLENREGEERTEAISRRLVCSFDLTDGTFTPCPELADIAESICWFGPTRCFGYTEQRLISYALDEQGLPTLEPTGEVNERWRLRLYASECYLFESWDEHRGAEIVACDHEMRLISREPVTQVPNGWIFDRDNMVAAEVRDATNPGILVMASFSRKNEGWGNDYLHVSFYDPEFRNLVWQHGGPGYPFAHLLDGHLVRRVGKEVELIDIRTGATNRISFGGWEPELHSATGYTLEQTDMADRNSVGYDDPPRHIFWRETCYSPLSLGVVVDSETAGPAPLPVVAPPVRERKKPDYGIPSIPERPGAHILCTKDSESSAQMKAFGEWLPFFRKGGVNLYGYIYNPSGEGDLSDSELKEIGHTRAEIRCIRLAATDDWHDPAALAADLRRCEALVPEEPKNSRSRKMILRELEHLIGLCDNAAAGIKVQLLAPPADCEDDDNWFDEGEEDDDEDE